MDDQTNSALNLPISKVEQAPRARWRVIARRVLKYSTLVFLFLATCVTIAAWSADARQVYHLTVPYRNSKMLLLTSRKDGVWFGCFSLAVLFDPNYIAPGGIHFQSYSRGPGDMTEKVSPTLTKLGVGIINSVEYYDPRSTPTANNVPNPPAFPTGLLATLKGFGIVLPHWMLLFGLVSLFAFIAMGRRFTLRMFLIWITIACVSLGLALRTAESSAKSEQRKVEPETKKPTTTFLLTSFLHDFLC